MYLFIYLLAIPIISRMYKNNMMISMYRFKAAKMYSSGDKEYFLLPPSISCVSKTRYFKKTKYNVNLTYWLFKIFAFKPRYSLSTKTVSEVWFMTNFLFWFDRQIIFERRMLIDKNWNFPLLMITRILSRKKKKNG